MMNLFLHKLSGITIIALFCTLIPQISASQLNQYNHDYSQTLVMKMFLALPDQEQGTKVFCDFSRALELIKHTDDLSLGAPKIIYLVGWQYNGHDDKYPAFFEVNPELKRPGDVNARESLLWLMKEAKQYNTTVSLHINMTDAYDDSPLWNEYVENDLISKNEDGSLMVIGNYNNRKAYQINYRNEWEMGYTQMRIDKLLDLLPALKDAGTIHIDAWIARESKGHNEPVEIEREYQKKALQYWRSKGLDVSSEWVMDYMTGLVPHYWHFNHRTQQDYLNTPANILTGTRMNPDLTRSDFALEFLFGTSMYGEGLFPNERNNYTDDQWEDLFVRDFYLNFLQYAYLNRLQRLKVEGADKNRTAYFSGNVNVSLADSTVNANGILFRKGNSVFFLVPWNNNNSISAYSEKGGQFSWQLPETWKFVRKADIYSVTRNGLIKTGQAGIKNNLLELKLEPGKPLVITPIENNR
jgi:hypothetical protein